MAKVDPIRIKLSEVNIYFSHFFLMVCFDKFVLF